MPSYALFAVTAPGLEPMAAQELAGLELLAPHPVPDMGGVEFDGDLRALYRANLHLRTASRVLVTAGEFYATALWELRKKAARLPWENFLSPGQRVALRVTCRKSKLYHSGAVAERVAGAIGDRLGGEVPHDTHVGESEDEAPPAQLVVARLLHDRCTIRVDSSGALLHQRGYRLATAKAPLRETLAAAMLLASGWDAAAPLLDPFCGSGTIPIEAALLARRIAPGRARRFAFMDWPGFDAKLWTELLEEADAEWALRATQPPAPILGSDRDAGAIEAAQANAERAGVGGLIQFSRRAVSAIEPPPGPGWVVTNPPYGVRVSEGADLRNLYAQFGRVLRAHCPGWNLAMLSAGAQLERQVGVDFSRAPAIRLVNGGVHVRLVQGRVASGG